MAKKSKLRNPTDTTVRNVRAANKRIADLSNRAAVMALDTQAKLDVLHGRLAKLEGQVDIRELGSTRSSVDRLSDQVDQLERRVATLEHPGATAAQLPVPDSLELARALDTADQTGR